MPVRVASWALDGISYATTKKSLTDHGLTMLANKDCATWRILKGKNICQDAGPADVAVASAAPETPVGTEAAVETVAAMAPARADTASAPIPERPVEDIANFETAAGGPSEPVVEPAAVAVEVPAPGPLRAILAAAPPPHKPAVPRAATRSIPAAVPSTAIAGLLLPGNVTGSNIYFVIGSYAERDNADEQVGRFAALGPVIVSAHLDGHLLYRVTVGPFRRDALEAGRRALAGAGIFDAWAVRLNPASWTLAGPSARPGANLAEARP